MADEDSARSRNSSAANNYLGVGMRRWLRLWINKLAVRFRTFRHIKVILVALQGRIEAIGAPRLIPSGIDRNELLPDFLCIGAQKSATTWLHSALSLHPNLYMPTRRKEIRFFGHQEHLGMSWYMAHFVDGLGAVKGEAFPGYGPMPVVAIERLKQNIPKLKIIMLLRDPIDRAWSHARMGLIRDGQYHFENINEDQWKRRLGSASCLSHGSYSRIIKNWQGVFSQEQMYIGFFDRIVMDPDQEVKKILGFLGLDAHLFPGFGGASLHKNETDWFPMPSTLERFVATNVIDDLRELVKIVPSPETHAWLHRAEIALGRAK